MGHNEKKTPHYKLEKVKRLIEQGNYNITQTALNNAACDFDIGQNGIVACILEIQNTYFYKSMTSEYDHKVWQDVYHVPINKEFAYVKLQIDLSETSVIIQFKRK